MKLRIALAALAAILLLSGATQAATSAATLYVSPTGSDSAACTSTAPCKSFNAAYQRALPGDTVSVAAGTYGNQTILADADKAVGSAEVVIRANGVVTAGDLTVKANDVRTVDIDVSLTGGGQPTVLGPAQNVVIEGGHSTNFYVMGNTRNVTILGGEYGPYSSCGGGSHIKTNTNGGDGPLADQPVNTVVDGIYTHDFTVPSSCPDAHLDCMHIFHHRGVVVRNSTFARCEHYGILWDSNGPNQTEDGDLLENNTFTSSGIAGFALRGENGVEAFENGPHVRGNTADDGLTPQTANALSGLLWERNTARITPCRSGITYTANIVPDASSLCGPTDTVQGSSPPPPPPPAACADSLDNDGDGLVDLNDPGCVDAADTDEFNAPPPPPPAGCDAACEQSYRDQIAALEAQVASVTAARDALQDKLNRIGAIVNE